MLCVLICIKSLREVDSKMVDIMGHEGHREEKGGQRLVTGIMLQMCGTSSSEVVSHNRMTATSKLYNVFQMVKIVNVVTLISCLKWCISKLSTYNHSICLYINIIPHKCVSIKIKTANLKIVHMNPSVSFSFWHGHSFIITQVNRPLYRMCSDYIRMTHQEWAS